MDLLSVFAYRLARMATRLTLCVVIVCRTVCPYHHHLVRWTVLHCFPAFVVPVVFNALDFEFSPHVLRSTGLYHYPAHH